jgi:hypothetical protein
LVFEDRETLRWQVQEMCRVEGIRDPGAVQREIDVYNELVPGTGELSATLFIEITDSAAVRSELDRLVGIDEHVSLWVGDSATRARFDSRQMEEERISAVQYIRFSLSRDQMSRFSDARATARLVIDHPHYAAETTLPEPVHHSLANGLLADPAPLLDIYAPPPGVVNPPAEPSSEPGRSST